MRKGTHPVAEAPPNQQYQANISEDGEIELCELYEEVVYPTAGLAEDGNDYLIINTPVHKQGIRVTRCLNTGVACANPNVFLGNYRTECKQRHAYRELLSLSPNGTVFKQKFAFPVYCSCAVYRVDD